MVGPHDEIFRALGRYVAIFSALVAIMRNTLATRIAGQEDIERELTEYALSTLTAEPVTNAFFAACRTIADFDREDSAIEAKLRKAILQESKRRNDLLHGDWVLDDRRSVAALMRYKPGRVSQDPLAAEGYNAEKLDAASREVEALYAATLTFARVALGLRTEEAAEAPSVDRVAGALEIVGGRLRHRTGIPVPRWTGF